jgi:hypothetical protein
MMRRFALRPLLLVAGLAICFDFAGCNEAPPPPAPDLSRLPPCDYGKPVFFGAGADGDRHKLTGWSGAEAPFTWSDGIAASLAVRVPTTPEQVQIQFRMCGLNVPKRIPGQRVDVFVNSERLVRWQVADEQLFTLPVPQKFTAGPDPLLIIDFYMPTATAPASIGAGGDRRRLGVRLAEMIVTKGAPQPATTQPTP